MTDEFYDVKYEKSVVASNGDPDFTLRVGAWSAAGSCIKIEQEDDILFLNDPKQARKVIKAIRKAAKHLGWEAAE